MKNKLVRLKECHVGLFMYEDTLCLKTEYGNEAYIVWSGECFWGGSKTKDEIGNVMVLPIDDSIVQKIEKRYGKIYRFMEKVQ